MPGIESTPPSPREGAALRSSPATTAKPNANAAEAAADTSIASSTPPTDTSAGSPTDPTAPPSGTASCRQPSAIPRSSGVNSRSSEVIPATGTPAPPMPANSRSAA